MKKETGVWIDSEQACIVNLTEDGSQVTTMASGIQSRVRFEGETTNFNRRGTTFMDPESHQERRHYHEAENFLRAVKGALAGSEAIVILGPAQMKKWLENSLQEDKAFVGKLLGVESAPKMSENQLVAWVKDYFSHIAEAKH